MACKRLLHATLIIYVMFFATTAQAARAINGVGTEFAVYDATGVNFSPTPPPGSWYIPPLRLKITVGLYNLQPSDVHNQIVAMKASGQTDIAIPIWISEIAQCEHSSCNDGVYDGVWGEVIDDSQGHLLPQHQQNLLNILDWVEALGFKRVIIRFNQYWSSSASSWDETKYQYRWNFIVNTRNLVESTLAGSSVETLYDLGGELGGLTSGVNSQYTKRLWQDYYTNWGNNKTVGFSFAWAPGRFTQMMNTYQQTGVEPPRIWAFDIYPHAVGQSLDMRTHLQNISNEMGERNGQPIIILETWHNDSGTASEINSALNGPNAIPNLNLDGLFQWSLLKDRSLLGLDKNFSHQAITNQSYTNQISNYQGLVADRRVNLQNKNSNILVLVDSNCATTNTLHCTITEKWGAVPAGKILVISTTSTPKSITPLDMRTTAPTETLHGCVNSPGSQPVSWITQNRHYTFIARYNTTCALTHTTPVTISSVSVVSQ